MLKDYLHGVKFRKPIKTKGDAPILGQKSYFKSGNYKGIKVSEVCVSDPAYIEYLYTNTTLRFTQDLLRVARRSQEEN